MTGTAPPVSQIDETPRPQSEPARATFASRLLGLFIASELVGILAPLILVALGMTMAFPGFASPFNLDALLATIAVTSVVGLAQVSVLAIGQFNLALPAIGAFSGMVPAGSCRSAACPGRSRCC